MKYSLNFLCFFGLVLGNIFVSLVDTLEKYLVPSENSGFFCMPGFRLHSGSQRETGILKLWHAEREMH